MPCNLLKLTLVAALAGFSAACATTQDAPDDANLSTTADRHKIVVNQRAPRLDISVREGDAALTDSSLVRIAGFAKSFVRSGHGALVLSTPSGSANADEAAIVAQTVRMQLAANGVPFAVIAGSTYDADGAEDPPIVLSFTLFEAQAPECKPLWSQDLSDVSANMAWDSFGCSVQANLAGMIADPADLIEPREEEPRDAARRAVVLEAFRQGKQTHATRSNDERVSVSNAVQ